MLHFKLELTFAKDHSFLWAHLTPVAPFNSCPEANWPESFPRPQPQASPEPESEQVSQGVAKGGKLVSALNRQMVTLAAGLTASPPEWIIDVNAPLANCLMIAFLRAVNRTK